MAIAYNGQKFSEKEMQKLIDAGLMGVGYKNDPASTTLAAPALALRALAPCRPGRRQRHKRRTERIQCGDKRLQRIHERCECQ